MSSLSRVHALPVTKNCTKGKRFHRIGKLFQLSDILRSEALLGELIQAWIDTGAHCP
jgi:hypothetical protein